jgi:predicted ATP-dependent endonuclease of OLD family
MLRVKSINIENINGIRSLELLLHDGINIICGPNGIGKSTIVECIVGSLMSDNNRLTRNVDMSYGTVITQFSENSGEFTQRTRVGSFSDSEVSLGDADSKISSRATQKNVHNILYFRPNRLILYQVLSAIQKQQKKSPFQVAKDYIANGIPLEPSKNWLAHRDLYSHYPDGDLTENNRINLEAGKNIFSVLDDKVKFSRISKNNDVMVETPSGIIPMEYLSSGYQASVLTLLAIIRELEARSEGDPAKITDFDGVVIIDEIDVHLHPTWQARILDGLRALLPKAQIILTTHSPHIIQSARANEVIPLEGENGHLRRREVQVGASGFQGWTVEEILRDVMGLTQTRPAVFTNLYEAFDTAVQNDDLETASKLYAELEQMLHPTSDLKTILKLHLDSLGGVLEHA